MPLKRGTVELSAYDPSWAETYKQEEKRLKKALGDSAIEIRHDGSTAVDGMAAKPIIDILLAIKSLDDIDSVERALKELGYEHVPQADLPGRIFFSKGKGDMREFHLSLTEKDNFHWKNHLLFLEQLRNNARVRDEYTRLKQTLAKKFPRDRGAYTAGKREFIDTVLASPEDKFKEK